MAKIITIKPILIKNAIYMAWPKADSYWSEKEEMMSMLLDWKGHHFGYVEFLGTCLMNTNDKNPSVTFEFRTIGKQATTLYIRENDLFDFLGGNNE